MPHSSTILCGYRFNNCYNWIQIFSEEIFIALVLLKPGDEMKLDLLIKGGTIVDGRGAAPYMADVGVKGEYIQTIGRLGAQAAERVIVAQGLVVCPGFVDIHSHSDYNLLINPRAESKVRQGVTTEVGGNCGYSAAPIWGKVLAERRQNYREQFGLELDWQGVDEYSQRLETRGLALNYAPLVGHNTIRASVMGLEDRAPTPSEMQQMEHTVALALRQGVFGLSTGLIYPPACYAKTDELIRLARIVRQWDGIFTAHIRGEGKGLLPALEEMVEIAGASGVSTQVSHLKTAGEGNWDKLQAAFDILEEAIAEGLDMHADRYPYLASHTGLAALLPDWFFVGGVEEQLARLQDTATRERLKEHMLTNHPQPGYWDKVHICLVSKPEHRRFEGRSVAQAAAGSGKGVADFILDLLLLDRIQVEALYFIMNEDNLGRILKKPYVMVGSDSACRADYGPLSQGKPHPRAFGTFPRVIRRYVREQEELSLAEAIYKMSYLPCSKLGIAKRGWLQSGNFADIVVFDLDKIADRASYENPISYPQGIHYVIVNGKITVEQGEHTGALGGRVLNRVKKGEPK
jgi:N-acyl-D-aspartate/D-glutamate deacylase